MNFLRIQLAYQMPYFMVGVVAEVEEHLPSKQEASVQTPVLPKKIITITNPLFHTYHCLGISYSGTLYLKEVNIYINYYEKISQIIYKYGKNW
jgi:hypothetical protein